MSAAERLVFALAEYDRQCLRRSAGHRLLPTVKAAGDVEDAIGEVAREQGRSSNDVRRALTERLRADYGHELSVAAIVGGDA